MGTRLLLPIGSAEIAFDLDETEGPHDGVVLHPLSLPLLRGSLTILAIRTTVLAVAGSIDIRSAHFADFHGLLLCLELEPQG